MKIAVIGDIHGTDKFAECYKKIQESDNDVDKIIVMGDWFDPYDDIPFDLMVERFEYFLECLKSDDRIISLIGNHDIEGYIIRGETNRTARNHKQFQKISEEISKVIPESYLVYKTGNWLFSHAGVSQEWINLMKNFDDDYPELILSNKKGWSENELTDLCSFYHFDFSGYGNDVCQGCTWIRPQALLKSLPVGYNQVVGHTQVTDIVNLKDADPEHFLENDIWIVDNQRKPEYLIINIEESE